MKSHSSLLGRATSKIKSHKIASSIIALVCIAGIYGIYSSVVKSNILPQYTLSMARLGRVIQTVTGSGQISSSNQTDILGQVSGTIKTINVSVGQSVHAGDIIATIDSTNAALSLESARISYEKTVQPAKAADISNSQNTLSKAYNDGFGSAANIYLDLPNIMTGMKDLLYGRSGFLSDQTSSNLSSVSRKYRDAAGSAFDRANNSYTASVQEFNNLTRNSATSSINTMLDNTYMTIKTVSEAVSNAQNAISYIRTYEPNYNSSAASIAATNVNSWASQANSDLSNLISSQNSIESSANSLSTLLAGSDALDIRSAQLNLEQAQRTYDNYFIRAPYDGVIGRIPVNVFGQAGSGTTIATIIGQQKIASLSLNEVDAAKVQIGQQVKITFDAIDGLNATGTVSSVDQIGTVSNGVVSYGVKVSISTADPRIKPGMSVNTSIITKQIDNALIVPSGAIKTIANMKYIQTLDPSALNLTSSTTRRTLTISTATTPKNVKVTVGDSDDTNTAIISGINNGDYVITKTVAGGSSTLSTAPSLLSSLGARGPGAGGGNNTRTSNGTAGASGATRFGN